MTAHSSSTQNTKQRIAKTAGGIFIALCLLVSALTIGLPHGSRAASAPVLLTPAADTYASSREPARSFGTSTHIDVRGKPSMTSFLSFKVSGLGQNSMANAHLRLYSLKDSDKKAVTLQLYAVTASWDEQAVSWTQQPALSQLITQSGPAVMPKNQWIDLDLGQTITGDGVYSFALTSNSSSQLSFRSSVRTEAPQLVLTLQDGSTPPAGSVSPTPATAPTAVPTAVPPVVSGATPAAAGVQTGLGYLGGIELMQRAQLANQGIEPYKSAKSDVIAFADSKLNTNPAPQQPLDIPNTDGPFVDDTATAYGLALAYMSLAISNTPINRATLLWPGCRPPKQPPTPAPITARAKRRW